MKKYLANQTFRYLLSGILSFSVENVSFSVFYYALSMGHVVSNVLSIVIALIVNFFVSKKFVFRDREEAKVKTQFAKYALLVLVNLIISTNLIGFLIGKSVPAYLAKFLVTCLVITWTYFIYQKIIFVKRGKEV
jgi:putative flippase GtrA